MKRQIRLGVFETNSSSTHSLTMCSAEDYEKWTRGDVVKSDDAFITREEAIELLKNDQYFKKYNPNFDFSDEDAVNEILREYDYYTYDDYFNDEYMEGFKDTYTTKNGEKIIAFGKYGYDG